MSAVLLSQYRKDDGGLQVVAREGTEAYEVRSGASLYALAMRAAGEGARLRESILSLGLGRAVDLDRLAAEGRLAPPLVHPDPAQLHLTGSAAIPDPMHASSREDGTDTMRMFRTVVEGGKPANGHSGVQPEWFYKGNGAALVAPGAALASPSFALDGGEEPEIAGLYVIGPDGTPFRLGFALAKEFSDHVTERQNDHYLAQSKLRPCAVGPELLIGELPARVEGKSRIRRGGSVVFEKPFRSGEAHMSHAIANLEHHHFRHDLFRQPGDVHIHLFGTGKLSSADGVTPQDGDIFEIEAAAFGVPLCNPLAHRPPGRAAPLTEIRTS